ncbi:bifunctional methylenetetrahydrofolate dehydrogenase/methenyltetrahydrofolate cyclohydrolase, partial [Candidatus Peregrinibacteria bacterium]|nr:bifunctional methylenetetrahydrofolate dehydrogenase/methenyltetrahydrofolate cyclohydrolase [Candidatus Peregrinibacteria bacterium]
MKILDGRKVANERLDIVTGEVRALIDQGITPRLAVVFVGDNPASASYVRQKEKACKKTGILYEHVDMPDTATTEEVIAKVNELDARADVHGILVQLPLPAQVEAPLVIRAIQPSKDVDGFHAYNIGKMTLSTDFESLVPCTPKGVIRLLEAYDIPIQGQEAVVVGHSNIVGKPMSTMLLNRDATVTTCHKETQDLAFHTRRADILVVAVGKAGLITEDMVKEGAVVVDVGINRVEGKLVGDVDFE